MINGGTFRDDKIFALPVLTGKNLLFSETVSNIFIQYGLKRIICGLGKALTSKKLAQSGNKAV